MEVEVFDKAYQVKLGEIGYFEFEGFRLNKVLFANIRSINGKIGDVSFDKEILKKSIMDFLRVGTNVELVNILSRELNKYNYFEIYDKIKISNTSLKLEDLIGENELPVYTGTSYLDSIKSNSKNNYRLVPSEVISHINQNISLYKHIEIEKFDFYPIWYINGPKNDGKCELYCHFNILIHLLSKVFVEFRSQILDLAGIDIQKAVARNQTIENFIELSKEELLSKLETLEREKLELTNKNLSLTEKVDEVLKELRDRKIREEELLNEIRASREEIDILTNMNIEANDKLSQNLEVNRDTNTELHIVSDMFTVMKDDLNNVMFQSQILAEELTRQTIENHSTETIEFNLIFFTSTQIPKSSEKRGLANDDRTWIGCSVCEDTNISRVLPYDKRVLYQRVVNSRDTCKFIYDNLNEFFIERYYKHILVENSRINDFLNEVDRILDAQSSHQSVRTLEVIKTLVSARNVETRREEFKLEVETRTEDRELELKNRKQELLEMYGENIYIRISGYRRRVYLENWEIRYGRGGLRRRALTREEILNGEFSSERDQRIHYE